MEDCDLLTQANIKAEKIKDLAQINLEKAVRQNQNLDVLEEKTKQFEKLAMVFEKETNEVKKQARWEHWKWKLILALVTVAVILFFYFQFFGGGVTVVTKSDNSSTTSKGSQNTEISTEDLTKAMPIFH